MISYTKGSFRFNYRAAGILIHNHRVLLHRGEIDGFWALPGGRVEWMEHSRETIVREMKEEIGLDCQIERLVWVAEDFFDHEGLKFHELGFYYLLSCQESADQLEKDHFYGHESDQRLVFQWFPINELDRIPLYPVFLRKGIQKLPQSIQHVIYRNDEELYSCLTER